MKYEDLSFTVKYDNGEELINDITAVIPNPKNNEEPYVTFTDYTIDEKGEFNTYYSKRRRIPVKYFSNKRRRTIYKNKFRRRNYKICKWYYSR